MKNKPMDMQWIKENYLFLLVPALVLMVAYASLFILSDQTLSNLAKEDGFYEYFGAISFLASSLIFFILYLKSKKGNDFFIMQTKKNIIFLLLALMFFFAFGEEISWGQRIIGIDTPDILDDVNMQGEINIHNIKIFHGADSEGNRKSNLGLIFNIDRLFIVFMLLFCVLIPAVTLVSKFFSKFIQRINIPIVPLLLGIFFLGNYIIYKIIEPSPTADLHNFLTETKESLFAFMFLVVAVYFRKNLNKNKNSNTPQIIDYS